MVLNLLLYLVNNSSTECWEKNVFANKKLTKIIYELKYKSKNNIYPQSWKSS